MVLVDAAHEDQHEPDSMKSPANRLPASIRSGLCGLLPTLGQIGLVRLMLRSSNGQQEPPPPGLTVEQAGYLRFLAGLPRASVASGSEACHWDQSAAQARRSGSFGDLPLIVLTAGRGFTSVGGTEDKEAEAFHDHFVHELQPQLARLSTRGKQVLVENSGHAIQFEEPTAVINAVSEILKEVRSSTIQTRQR